MLSAEAPSPPYNDCSATWPEGVEGFLSDVIFADSILKADVEPISLVHHVEAGILMVIRNDMAVKFFLDSVPSHY